MPKNTRKGFPETQKQLFSELETSEKTILPLKKSFFNKVFGKKGRIMPENPKRDHLGSFKRFLQTENFGSNSRGYLLIEFKSFRKVT